MNQETYKLQQLAAEFDGTYGAEVNAAAEALSGVKSAANGDTSKLTTASSSDVVTFARHDVFPVKVNGIGMMPYMLAVALWLLAIALVLNVPLRREDDRQRLSFEQWGRQFYTLGSVGLLGVAGAFAAVYLQHGFQPKNWAVALVIAVLGVWVFISLNWILRLVFGAVGSWVALVLMIFQLAAAGGTYPLALSGKFFEVIHPFLPMSAVVDGMRTALSMTGNAQNELMILFSYLVVLTALIIGVYRFEQVKDKDLQIFPN
jgi:putative membrane protein